MLAKCRRKIFILIFILFLAFPIFSIAKSEYSDFTNIPNTEKLNLSSAFIESDLGEILGILINLLRQNKIVYKDIKYFIDYSEDMIKLARETNNEVLREEAILFKAFLLFYSNYRSKAEVDTVTILYGGTDWDAPVLIQTEDKKKYVLKTIKMKINQARYVVSVNEHLASKGLPVAKLYRTGDNDLLVEGSNLRSYVLYEFLDDRDFANKEEVNIRSYIARAELAGEILKAMRDFRGEEVLFDNVTKHILFYSLMPLFDNTLNKTYTSQEREFLQNQFEILEERYPKLKKYFRLGHIPGDLNPGNVAFDERYNVTGVIDISPYYGYIIAIVDRLVSGHFNVYTRERLKDSLLAFQAAYPEYQFSKYEILGILERLRNDFIMHQLYFHARHLFKYFIAFDDDFSDPIKVKQFVNEVTFRDKFSIHVKKDTKDKTDLHKYKGKLLLIAKLLKERGINFRIVDVFKNAVPLIDLIRIEDILIMFKSIPDLSKITELDLFSLHLSIKSSSICHTKKVVIEPVEIFGRKDVFDYCLLINNVNIKIFKMKFLSNLKTFKDLRIETLDRILTIA